MSTDRKNWRKSKAKQDIETTAVLHQSRYTTVLVIKGHEVAVRTHRISQPEHWLMPKKSRSALSREWNKMLDPPMVVMDKHYKNAFHKIIGSFD